MIAVAFIATKAVNWDLGRVLQFTVTLRLQSLAHVIKLTRD